MAQASRIIVGGAPEGFDAKVLLAEAERSGGPVIHVARDDMRLAATRDALGFFAPDMPVLSFPGWDCLPYDRVSPNPAVSAARMATLATLAAGLPGRFVLLTTLNAAAQRVPSRAVLAGSVFAARVGRRIDEEGLRGFIGRMGFRRAPTVTEPGDYSIRGGIVDIYPPGEGGPVRLDLFGDVLDGARRFDPATQLTTERLERVEIAPASEVILDEEAVTRFREAYRAEFGAGDGDPVYDAVSAGRAHAGVEHWLPFFHGTLDTLFDYLPGAPVCLDDQADAARAWRWEGIVDQYEARREAMSLRGRPDAAVYKPCPPGLLYLDEAAWQAALGDRRAVQFHPLAQPSGPGTSDAGGRAGRNFAPERLAGDANLFDVVVEHVRARAREGAVVIAAYSEGSAERFGHLLEDHGMGGARRIGRAAEAAGAGDVALAVWPIESGFEAPGLTVVAEQDVLGDRLVRAPAKKRRAENFLTEARSLANGDLVVHVDHGVGRFTGLEVIDALGAARECVALEYAGGDRLLLPVENIELLSRYGQEEGALDRLGGAAWQARKARLKDRIGEMAHRLIRVAAERDLRRAAAIAPPAGLWDDFVARFPYQETDSQAAAIADVLDDLASGRPMDRLVCGDVGFGKTEVAMRAAFVAAMSGRQVAVIAPTTLLARQHHDRFRDRFRGYPLQVRQLSRFVSAKEAGETRAAIGDGSADIVVGTHALLAKGVRFSDLGLLVIDEEQHFGVAHKERLKELSADVHVLQLTATPIPRTLQLSLTGVRDISIIGTPPVDRLAIRTYVSEFDAVTIREALLRERYRGGQAFFVVPRIGDLPGMEEFLREQVPEASFVTAHGQMAAGLLDERMNAFYDGRYDVLLATTIVESGLDIPTANTLVVHRADAFGLAQLYQIRGRVGRSKTRAYAYLTTKPGVRLTEAARKRLRVLGSLDSLGAGFSLASQDLDIRGAGNLLGEEQSGRIQEVGHELYQSMLEDAIARIRSGEADARLDAQDQWSPRISLGVPALIPEGYVPDLDVRLALYRRLGELHSRMELEGFAAELIDRFGPLPGEVTMLMMMVRVKESCLQAGIAKLDGGPRGATIQFHGDRFANPAGLVDFINAQDGLAKVRDNRLVVRRDWRKGSDRIKGAHSIAGDLARLAKG